MENNTIKVDHKGVAIKISELKQIQTEIKSLMQISSWEFGRNSDSNSTGKSSEAMNTLNQEYADFMQLFNQLIDLSANFLQNTSEQFKEADQTVSASLEVRGD